MTDYSDFDDRGRRLILFQEEILRAFPRLLSSVDRCPVSATGGCMDREYWAWATKDFANMDAQRGVYPLAYFFHTPFQGNVYLRQPALLEWIRLAVRFWIGGQSPRGAFDHLYVHENSWMAAAFTLVDMVAAFRLVKEEMDPKFAKAWMAAMERAGRHLIGNGEEHGFISNHRAGAAAGLLGLHNLTGDEAYKTRAWSLMDEVYRRQSLEGWFLEYEGADPGYQTLDTHYQAIFLKEAGFDAPALDAVKRSIEWLAYFVHPDGSVGGDYGSRACPHYWPGGFEALAARLPAAEGVARLCTAGYARVNSSGPRDADDRNFIPLLTSYTLAHSHLMTQGEYPAERTPCARAFERIWPECGIYIRSTPDKYVIFGGSKGGVVKIFDKVKRELIQSSCGFVGKLADGAEVTTLVYTAFPDMRSPGLEPGAERPLRPEAEVTLNTRYYEFKTKRFMAPLVFLGFRIFNLTVGRIKAVNDFVRKHIIIGWFLKSRKACGATLERTLRAHPQRRIELADLTTPSPSRPFVELRERAFFSAVYMASAKYFRNQDLRNGDK